MSSCITTCLLSVVTLKHLMNYYLLFQNYKLNALQKIVFWQGLDSDDDDERKSKAGK